MYPWQSFVVGLCEHLAWPILLSVCIFVFKNDICKMLSRMTKLPGGTELSPETIKEQKESKSDFEEAIKKATEEVIIEESTTKKEEK